MANAVAKAQAVSVDRVFLDLSNPRHEPYKNEAEVIEYLCQDEYVYELAKDIVKMGSLNPLELFALIPLNNKKGSHSAFVVAEGNRRMCAIKLLNDPELAPAKLRKDFKKIAEQSSKISEILGVVFEDKDQVDAWLERIHGGVQGGIGRKPWSTDQKTRHLGDNKNLLAQTVLDYAEKNGFISTEARKGKLTTAQRYLGNAILREAMGIDGSAPQDISRNRPKQDFDLLLKKFVSDLIDGTVSSRSNSDDIKKYSRALAATEGLTGKRGAAESLATSSGSKKRKKRPSKPEKQKHLPYEEEILNKLKVIPSYKLERIYYSLCDISLEHHTPLISVGVWAFFECLTALCGRNSSTSFLDYLSKDRLNKLGFTDREDVKSLRQALERISEHGNTTKHHEKAANFNGPQLANDMDLLKEVICRLANEAKK